MIGMLTDATCGYACWYAREEDCRCSCAGRNHGALLIDGAETPRRNCKIDGRRYVLGRIAYQGDSTTADRYSWANWIRRRTDALWASNGPGAILWERTASPSQIARWDELADARGLPAYVRRPLLIWIREDQAEDYDRWIAAGRPLGERYEAPDY